MDLRAGTAGRGGSVWRDTHDPGSRDKGRLDTLGDVTAWGSLPHLELPPFGEKHVSPEL